MAWHLGPATFCSTKTVWPRESESESHPADSLQYLVYGLLRGDLSISVKWMPSDGWLRATILMFDKKISHFFLEAWSLGIIHWVVVFYKLPVKIGPQSQWELIWTLGWTQQEQTCLS